MQFFLYFAIFRRLLLPVKCCSSFFISFYYYLTRIYITTAANLTVKAGEMSICPRIVVSV